MRNILEVLEGKTLDPSVQDQARGIEHFEEKFDALHALILNEQGFSSHKRMYLLQEASTTSDFPILFGNVLERQLLARYTLAKPDWRQYIGVGTQKDFRANGQEILGIWGLQGKMPKVALRGEYKQDKEVGEGKVSITLSKFGRLFGLAWETVLADYELGAFNDVAERLNNAALVTEFYEATSLIAAAAGPHASLYGAPITHPIDGASITNKGTLKLSGASGAANLGTTVGLMQSQVDKDGNPIVIVGFELVVPPLLRIAMLQILNAISVPSDTEGRAISVIRQMSITGHVNEYLPIIDVSANKNTTWYLFARLANGQAARLNFLAGRTSPELVLKAPNKVAVGGGAQGPLEGDFESDSILWRERHIMGGTQIDPRVTYAQDGTT
ncbi:hypothetical protein LCGC14_2518510 [marine sediment metagenome]|uniref:Bacteriophage Mu GpT domain-containing protein n=1 Tax=marine sediment metagenome TaxID=412755 RepID=A0A0F9DQE8_9ZZZZ